jgi:gluconate 2-dehydrogenase gamma chain
MVKKENEKQEKLFGDFLAGKINRRAFLIAVSTFAGGYGLSLILPDVLQFIRKPGALNPDQENTLREVQRHLFPSTNASPGADEINALAYLQLVLLDPVLDPRDQKFIINGIGWLEEECLTMFSTGFTNLEFIQKEEILRKIEKENWGERWLSDLLKYIFEALLTDPLYGGNPEGIGWEWLTHAAGIPRPSEANRYRGAP